MFPDIWLLARSENTLPIPGFKIASQVRQNAAASDFAPLSTSQMAQIEELLS